MKRAIAAALTIVAFVCIAMCAFIMHKHQAREPQRQEIVLTPVVQQQTQVWAQHASAPTYEVPRKGILILTPDTYSETLDVFLDEKNPKNSENISLLPAQGQAEVIALVNGKLTARGTIGSASNLVINDHFGTIALKSVAGPVQVVYWISRVPAPDHWREQVLAEYGQAQ